MGTKTPGQINFEAYCKSSSAARSGLSDSGAPTFDELKVEIKNAWEAAATAVIEDEKAQAECGA